MQSGTTVLAFHFGPAAASAAAASALWVRDRAADMARVEEAVGAAKRAAARLGSSGDRGLPW
jgi:hypothetical protein